MQCGDCRMVSHYSMHLIPRKMKAINVSHQKLDRKVTYVLAVV